jgi:hypothetical protein
MDDNEFDAESTPGTLDPEPLPADQFEDIQLKVTPNNTEALRESEIALGGVAGLMAVVAQLRQENEIIQKQMAVLQAQVTLARTETDLYRTLTQQLLLTLAGGPSHESTTEPNPI